MTYVYREARSMKAPSIWQLGSQKSFFELVTTWFQLSRQCYSYQDLAVLLKSSASRWRSIRSKSRSRKTAVKLVGDPAIKCIASIKRHPPGRVASPPVPWRASPTLHLEAPELPPREAGWKDSQSQRPLEDNVRDIVPGLLSDDQAAHISARPIENCAKKFWLLLDIWKTSPEDNYTQVDPFIKQFSSSRDTEWIFYLITRL